MRKQLTYINGAELPTRRMLRLPESFYRHLGFASVEQTHGLDLLWLSFTACSRPTLWSGNFRPAVRADGVHIDVIHTSQCPGEKTFGIWHSLIAEYGDKASISEYLADDRGVMDIDCVPGSMGVFVNGQRVPRDLLSRTHAKQVIEHALQRISSVEGS